jgi:2-phosphosulfolactate phosphatase
LPDVRVVLTAQELGHQPLGGCAVVLLDVLRATTVVATALAHGARWVMPVAGVEEARARARSRPGALLAGERGGDPPPGFALGNSPVQVARLRPRELVLTTTNGTLAAERAASLVPPPLVVYAGALVNRGAVARALEEAGADVVLACAGQQGHAAAEDLLAAGAIAQALPARWRRDDLAYTAQWAFASQAHRLTAALAETPHGQELVRQGYAQDVAFCASLDRLEVLPCLVEGPGGPAFAPSPRTEAAGPER